MFSFAEIQVTCRVRYCGPPQKHGDPPFIVVRNSGPYNKAESLPFKKQSFPNHPLVESLNSYKISKEKETPGKKQQESLVFFRTFTNNTGRKSVPGGLAQLGERLAGSQKVRGSSPLSSTL